MISIFFIFKLNTLLIENKIYIVKLLMTDAVLPTNNEYNDKKEIITE